MNYGLKNSGISMVSKVGLSTVLHELSTYSQSLVVVVLIPYSQGVYAYSIEFKWQMSVSVPVVFF